MKNEKISSEFIRVLKEVRKRYRKALEALADR